ncbi:hypothetical protein FJTKL_03587 [Diaporthe vaccinii]|uniref:Uncharacterized protein n=1 Tax=Diaporthe vaccinii TaxID=105482 RepID=A0ABR4DV24_9PEZI
MVIAALLGDTPAQKRYVTEAVRRKRADGMAQFQVLADSDDDRLRHLSDDPWADHAALDARPALISPGDRVKFLIMGAGIGGILNAVRLIQAGFSADQIRIVEIGGGIGGTWYWNRYPGLHCDVEAYIYMPLLEETGYMPSKKYAPAVEIRHHLEAVAKKFGLESQIVYRSRVDGLQWDESARAWNFDITASSGPKGQKKTTIRAQAEFVSLAVGLFPHPQYPQIPGLSSFKGDMFPRWPYTILHPLGSSV